MKLPEHWVPINLLHLSNIEKPRVHAYALKYAQGLQVENAVLRATATSVIDAVRFGNGETQEFDDALDMLEQLIANTSIAALLASGNWQMVPVVATDTMMKAADRHSLFEEAWKAALLAAPDPNN